MGSSSSFKWIAIVKLMHWEKRRKEALVRVLWLLPLAVILFSPFPRSLTSELSLILSHPLGIALAGHHAAGTAGHPGSLPACGHGWSSSFTVPAPASPRGSWHRAGFVSPGAGVCGHGPAKRSCSVLPKGASLLTQPYSHARRGC